MKEVIEGIFGLRFGQATLVFFGSPTTLSTLIWVWLGLESNFEREGRKKITFLALVVTPVR